MVGREKAPEAGAGRNDSRAKEGNKPPPPEFWQSVCVRGEGGGELRAPLHASCAKSKGCEVHSAWHAFCESFRLAGQADAGRQHHSYQQDTRQVHNK
eukprot:scaffold25606_cov20-Tisochrysis_lutea.AAC.1